MNSPSSNSSLLPTGGLSSARFWSTQARRLGGEAIMAAIITPGAPGAPRLFARARGCASNMHRRGVLGIEAQRGEASAPDAARVEPDHIGVSKESQRRPMAEDDARAAPKCVGRLEPRNE